MSKAKRRKQQIARADFVRTIAAPMLGHLMPHGFFTKNDLRKHFGRGRRGRL